MKFIKPQMSHIMLGTMSQIHQVMRNIEESIPVKSFLCFMYLTLSFHFVPQCNPSGTYLTAF